MIKVVDCTLRDGGHVNKSNFGERVIDKILNALLASKVDIIEVGFLRSQPYVPGTAIFSCIEDVKKVITPSERTEYSLMAQEDQYDVSKLEPCDGTIQHIRVSFHNYDFNEGLEFAKEVIKKGYKCHVNPINLQGYTDRELIDMIGLINEIKPHTFTIVDTFGAMTESDLNRVVAIVDNNLNPEISIGLHLHENLGLSFSLAQFFTKIKPPKRDISIDASLNGMGRVPGNLNIELFMNYMNRCFNTDYDVNPIYDAIDDCILPIKKEIPWGYSLPYALSAQYGLHRTYAEYLISKYKLKTKDIQNILANIKPEEKAVYNSKYIQKLYMEYLCNDVDDSKDKAELKKALSCGRKILLLAPGRTLSVYKAELLEFIKQNNPIVITVNFSATSLGFKAVDYSFFCNIRRFEQAIVFDGKLILTSNLCKDAKNASFVLNLRDLIFDINNEVSDNALLLLLKMLMEFNLPEVYIAGFDGFTKGVNYFDKNSIPLYDSMSTKYLENDDIKQILTKHFSNIKIKTLTPSLYIDEPASGC